MKRPFAMRRILALILLLASLASFTACSKYRVEMSSKAQTAQMFTLGEYSVTREVVDFFYYNRQSTHPKEDFATRLAEVEADIAELYAIFAAAESASLDPFGEEIDAMVDAQVKTMIDSFPTRRDYIDRISEINMTDTVCRLILRSSICESLLLDVLNPTDEELRAFCEQDDVIRVLTMQLNYDQSLTAWAEGRMKEILDTLADGAGTDAHFLAVARQMATADNEHTYITVGQWERLCGANAPAPVKGTLSPALYETDTVLLMRVTEKDTDYALEHPNILIDSYLEYQIENKIHELTALLERDADYLALTEESFV